MEKDLSEKIMSLAKRRGFVLPSYEIYGGVSGFYDYGPLGSLLKNNVESIWREYYVYNEGFLEINTPSISPQIVFEASGHLSEFADILARCGKCRESFRADHLLQKISEENVPTSVEKIRNMIEEMNVKCPKCGGDFEDISPFNLMFRTQIGPDARRVGYLRPETAQAMFVNFLYLYKFNRERMPFGVVQLGRGYRNEISPRQGMLRLREFNMAEAEIFVHIDDKFKHEKFDDVKDDVYCLVPSTGYEGKYALGEAVEKNIIKSEYVAYYIGITARFLIECGIDEKKLRFRQHLTDEMAHYAGDCWDAEVLLSYGWIEVVGIADRTCYDLTAHMKYSSTDLCARKKLDKPIVVKKKCIIPDMKKIGKMFREKSRDIVDILKKMDGEKISGDIEIEVNGERIVIPPDYYNIREIEEKMHVEKYIPHVVEPSYGIDRICYSILEHAYKEIEKEGEKYVILSLMPNIAPIKAGVFPLTSKDALVSIAKSIYKTLMKNCIMAYYDESGSIGRRYARMDEIGTPYCITVDHQSVEDDSCTIRFRETTEQVRVKISDVCNKIKEYMKCGITSHI